MIREFERPEDKLIFSLDVPGDYRAIDEKLDPVLGKTKWVKINSIFFGPARDYTLNRITEAKSLPMVDIKAHDIPSSTARNVIEAWKMGAAMVTIHASATKKAMKEVMDSIKAKAEENRPIVLAITVLTSIDKEILNKQLRVPGEPLEQVLHLAKLAQDAEMDGVVCSPQETEHVRQACGKDFLIVNPGIRFSGEKERDQARIGTPRGTIAKGATALVMGSDLLKDPVNNVPRAIEEIRLGLSDYVD